MQDFLGEKRSEIDARLKELKPLVDEYHRLEAAESALANVSAAPSSNGDGAPAKVTKPRAKRATGKPRGRPKGSGSRANEAVALVTENPGITIPEIADRMGIKQNYLYRVLPGLAKDGRVKKEGRGWHPQQQEA